MLGGEGKITNQSVLWVKIKNGGAAKSGEKLRPGEI